MLKHFQYYGWLPFTFLALFCGGCGPYLPTDYPKTYPCFVFVTKSGQPLEKATVVLASSSTPQGLVCSAITDVNGIASITTNYSNFIRKGAPQAEFAVTITKEPYVPDEKTKEEIASLSYKEYNTYQAERAKKKAAMQLVVPKRLTSPATSPITWNFVTPNDQLKIEVDDYFDK